MTTKRRKPGPRPLPAKARRRLTVLVSLNAAEYEAVTRCAGLTPNATWCRVAIMEKVEKQTK